CVVALHDVAPRTLAACRALAERLDALSVAPLALLVVPSFHGDPLAARRGETARWVEARRARGDEVVLHGYYHVADRRPDGLVGRLRARLLTAGEGEFQTLDEDEAGRRMAAGLAALEAAGMGRPRGFVAPAWLLGAAARRAARRLGFAYTTTHLTLDDLDTGLRHAAPVLGLSCRTPLRAAASRVAAPLLWCAARRAPRLRFALHPVDLRAPAALEALLGILEAARRDRPVVTYGGLLDACRAESVTRQHSAV
ncbi:MAG TPA: polysaccharide deacetylase family protein, partial [Thermodesulfobacteriota bacterium]